MENIALIGFMGSGKTTTGKLLAERLGWRFTDTDILIENAAGRSIPDIFANEGEVAFRNRETAAIQEACRGFCQVIATGGGAILRPDNIVELRGSSLIIWLTARPEVVVARTEKVAQSRPLLVRRDDDLFSHILKMLGERGPLYQSAAHLVIDTSDRSPDAVAGDIQHKWERRYKKGITT